MPRNGVSVNALAFVGPQHVPGLVRLCYVRVLRTDGSTATIRVVRPDTTGDDGEELVLYVSVLELRTVDPNESTVWPGDYVGHPIASILPARVLDSGRTVWSLGTNLERVGFGSRFYLDPNSLSSLKFSWRNETPELAEFAGNPECHQFPSNCIGVRNTFVAVDKNCCSVDEVYHSACVEVISKHF
ncbi:unnamed protein product [Phytophthora fragariaefolia]|uniref:Unnamed protein product n=1 Tax=Phytophthora fragariaefolia TaxID=1490495 RepID=A0A9W7D7U9_9STRA|nr:unnamed protein product [Phytophthora fragariaefolia]